MGFWGETLVLEQLFGLWDWPDPQSGQGSVISGKLLNPSVPFSVLELEIMTAALVCLGCVP